MMLNSGKSRSIMARYFAEHSFVFQCRVSERRVESLNNGAIGFLFEPEDVVMHYL